MKRFLDDYNFYKRQSEVGLASVFREEKDSFLKRYFWDFVYFLNLRRERCFSGFDMSVLPQNKILGLDMASGMGKFGDDMVRSVQDKNPNPVLVEVAGGVSEVLNRGVHWVSIEKNMGMVMLGLFEMIRDAEDLLGHHSRRVMDVLELLDKEAMAIPSHSFDVVSLCFMDLDLELQKTLVLEEVDRILKPGGVFLRRFTSKPGCSDFVSDADEQAFMYENKLVETVDGTRCRLLSASDMDLHTVYFNKQGRTFVESWQKKE